MLKTRRAHIVLLLADGFDEAAVGLVLPALREAGLPVSLVGLRAGQISGARGLVVVPDLSLERLLELAQPLAALILPGGAAHVARLRIDPRVGVLLHQCIQEKALLVGLEGTREDWAGLAREVDHSLVRWFIPEPGQPLEQFTATLIRSVQDMREG